ncbi:protein MKS1-like [Pyrus ussuriensis x Pyrus communis]|uniref:Protein MKS1-like n=1 Tax=Pyrus ussuriensis x Pyrus communis TaxID=2448454 RepID=A0A5N5I5Q2_9ROSA|nr:protein MKS1-like [Pyrus x bretschneideri]KAB2635149.1 protein MKS1-like [Pyrus ussuriensis x Pyrus communis]
MDYSTGKSPRRELQLQGPRPTPLRIHKDSHKIKKPPVVPQPSQQPNQQQQPHHYQQPRQPVIIYTVSPKVIHTNPSEFMDLVQRLTGLPRSNSSTTSSSPPSNNNINPLNHDNYNNPPAHDDQGMKKNSTAQDVVEEMEIMDDGGVKKGLFPGILSPGPASLTPIPSNFFSPPADSFFHDLSPVLYGNRNFIEGSFMPSPSNFFSPSTSIDLFNNFPYL